MIICHCNQISASEIRCAVKCMMTNCATPDLCPENVYQELGACPNCCACFPVAEEMIHETALQFFTKSQLQGEAVADEEGSRAA